MKLTPRQKQVYEALPFVDFEHPGIIARKAGVRTISSSETAAKFCIQLVKLGLAEKGGTRMFPLWRRAPSNDDGTKTQSLLKQNLTSEPDQGEDMLGMRKGEGDK